MVIQPLANTRPTFEPASWGGRAPTDRHDAAFSAALEAARARDHIRSLVPPGHAAGEITVGAALAVPLPIEGAVLLNNPDSGPATPTSSAKADDQSDGATLRPADDAHRTAARMMTRTPGEAPIDDASPPASLRMETGMPLMPLSAQKPAASGFIPPPPPVDTPVAASEDVVSIRFPIGSDDLLGATVSISPDGSLAVALQRARGQGNPLIGELSRLRRRLEAKGLTVGQIVVDDRSQLQRQDGES